MLCVYWIFTVEKGNFPWSQPVRGFGRFALREQQRVSQQAQDKLQFIVMKHLSTRARGTNARPLQTPHAHGAACPARRPAQSTQTRPRNPALAAAVCSQGYGRVPVPTPHFDPCRRGAGGQVTRIVPGPS